MIAKAFDRVRSRLGIGKAAAGDGASGIALSLVSILSSFVSFSLLGRHIGPSEYGSFAAMYGLIGTALTMAYIGPGLAMMQVGIGDSLKTAFPRYVSIHASIALIMLVITMVVSHFLVPGIGALTIFFFLAAELIGTSMLQLSINCKVAMDGYASSVRMQIVPFAIRVGVILVLFAVGRLTLAWYGGVFLCVTGTMGIVLLNRTARALGLSRRPAKAKGDDVRSSLTLGFTLWGFNVHNDGDKLTMSALHIGADVGLYTAAYRLIEFAVFPIDSIVTSSYRSFVDPGVGRQFQRAIKYTLAAAAYAVVVALGIIIGASVALPLLVGDKFEGASSIARWLAPLMVLRCLTKFPLNGLTGIGRQTARLVAIVVSASVAMVLYIVLIPHLSWRGAVIGSYASDTVLVVLAWSMLWIYSRRTESATVPEESEKALAAAPPG
jgi:O-antigen/teichoic acid export membrane protein